MNGHEYVARQAQKEGIEFTKEGNCFTEITDAHRLGLVAETSSHPDGAIGRVGGVDINKTRVRTVIDAVITLAPKPYGFTSSELAQAVQARMGGSESDYTPRKAAYDLKKLRGKNLIRKIEKSRKYQTVPDGLRALTAYETNKVCKLMQLCKKKQEFEVIGQLRVGRCTSFSLLWEGRHKNTLKREHPTNVPCLTDNHN